MLRRSLCLSCLLALVYSSSSSLSTESSPTVVLPDLGVIVGSTKTTLGAFGDEPKQYYFFQNIPYAESVSGERRFSQPVRLRSPLGTLSSPYLATRSGPLCPQLGMGPREMHQVTSKPIEQLVQERTQAMGVSFVPARSLVLFLERIVGKDISGSTFGEAFKTATGEDLAVSEDCLHLAVSTPRLPDQNNASANSSALLPVLVYLHGGSFRIFGNLMMGYERMGDVADFVLVTLNYRLGHLGFLCLDSDLASGNMGILDQIAALEFVRDNIAAFGGDPRSVTLAGGSVGGASAHLISLSALGQGLVSRVLAYSGSAMAPWAFSLDHERTARDIAATLDCNHTSLDDLVNCLKKVDVKDLLIAETNHRKSDLLKGGVGFDGVNACLQTKGDRKLFSDQDPLAILRSGNFTPIPVMFGVDRDEGALAVGLWSDFVRKVHRENNRTYLSHGIIDLVLNNCPKTNLNLSVDEAKRIYFKPTDFHSVTTMLDGLAEMVGSMSFKESSLLSVQYSSAVTSAFLFAMNKRSRKSTFRLLFQYPDPKTPAPRPNELACHGDEQPYLFHWPIPFLLCDPADFLPALAAEAAVCTARLALALSLGSDVADRVAECVASPDSGFMRRWGDCVRGNLDREELEASRNLITAVTNFVTQGSPSSADFASIDPWTTEQPRYFVIDSGKPSIKTDFRNTYATKRRGGVTFKFKN